MFIKNNKKLNKSEMEDTVVEIVKSAKAESQFSVFQIVIFAFLFTFCNASSNPFAVFPE